MRGNLAIGAGLLAFVLLESIGAFPAAAETMYVGTASARLRASESPLADVIEILRIGTEVEVLSRKGRFARVKTRQDKEGWVYLRRLTDAKPEGGSGVFTSLGETFRGTDASQTAATASARGVEESKGAGAKGGVQSSMPQLNRFGAELEKYRPTEDQLDRFLREGRLGEYAE